MWALARRRAAIRRHDLWRCHGNAACCMAPSGYRGLQSCSPVVGTEGFGSQKLETDIPYTPKQQYQVSTLCRQLRGKKKVNCQTWNRKSPMLSLSPGWQTAPPTAWRWSQSCECECWLWACCVHLAPAQRRHVYNLNSLPPPILKTAPNLLCNMPPKIQLPGQFHLAIYVRFGRHV